MKVRLTFLRREGDLLGYQVPLVFLKLSDQLAICATRVTGIMVADCNQAREMMKAERQNKTLLNGCGREKAKSMVIMDNGTIATSTSTMNRLLKLLEIANGKRVAKRTPRKNVVLLNQNGDDETSLGGTLDGDDVIIIDAEAEETETDSV